MADMALNIINTMSTHFSVKRLAHSYAFYDGYNYRIAEIDFSDLTHPELPELFELAGKVYAKCFKSGLTRCKHKWECTNSVTFSIHRIPGRLPRSIIPITTTLHLERFSMVRHPDQLRPIISFDITYYLDTSKDLTEQKAEVLNRAMHARQVFAERLATGMPLRTKEERDMIRVLAYAPLGFEDKYLEEDPGIAKKLDQALTPVLTKPRGIL